jgi:hypothetical protein
MLIWIGLICGIFPWKSAGKISGKSQFRRNQTTMTPGETGGVLGVLEIQSPEGGDTSQILYRRLRGSPDLYCLFTLGFTLGYNRFTPAILRGRLLRG